MHCSCSIPSKLYLVEGQDSLYVSSPLNYKVENGKTVVCFNYQELLYHVTGSDTTTDVLRSGIISRYESNTTRSETRVYAFGEGIDTCKMEYRYQKSSHYLGRSALVSVTNLFSKVKEDNQPRTSSGYGFIVGIMRYKNNSDSFFAGGRLGDISLEGKIYKLSEIRNAYRRKWGTIRWYEHGGIQVTTDEKIIAAITTWNNETRMYVSRFADPGLKLRLAAYLYLNRKYVD
jgi:hypothetical protein